MFNVLFNVFRHFFSCQNQKNKHCCSDRSWLFLLFIIVQQIIIHLPSSTRLWTVLFIFFGEGIAERLHIHAFGDNYAMDLKNVRLAIIKLDEAVMAVWAHIWTLASVGHAMMP